MTGELIFAIRIVLIAALYLFLGLAFYTLWQELRTNSLLLGSRQVPPIILSSGESGEEQQLEYNIPEIIVGRDPAAQFPISHENVSRQHARLSYHHNQWWLEDLNSTNGTFLNDERIYTPTVLISGDEIRIGSVAIQVLLKKPEHTED